MPELPEVETVRRGLLSIIGQRVVGCDVRRRDVVRDRTHDTPNPRRGSIEPKSLLIESEVKELVRKGKQLAIIARDDADAERVALIQLGMSGQVSLVDTPRISNAKHVHVVWTLDDGRRVVFRDARRFGGVTLLPGRDALERVWSALGPDGLTIRGQDLIDAIGGSQWMIKAALLDQGVLAGVGNIYADEALHRAGIDPRSICAGLRPEVVRALAKAIRAILTAAVKARGSTLRDYRDPSDQPGSAQLLHRVYGRGGEPCTTCGSTIEQTRIAQRSTCWCPCCQPASRA